MIRKAFRDWLMAEPKKAHDGPCGCGEHTLEHGGPPRSEIADQPDLNKPGYFFDEKRIVTTGQWLVTVWDKPNGYLLGAFIDEEYTAAMIAAKDYLVIIRQEQAMRGQAADPYATRNG